MRFAASLKFALLCTLAGTLALTLGCGFGSENLALTQGNWSVTATSEVVPVRPSHIRNQAANGSASFYVGGNLTQTGSSVSTTMYVANSLCFSVSQTVSFTGTVKDKDITLTSSSIEGQVITVKAKGSKSSLTGTYTIAGGCADGDHGTVTATVVPSITGTWSGPLVGNGGADATLSLALTQAATAAADGTFPLTGSLTFANSSCSVNGTITNSFIAGEYLVVNGSTAETDDSSGSFSYTSVFLNSPSAPTSMHGTYDVVEGLCAGDLDTPTFTKQ